MASRFVCGSVTGKITRDAHLVKQPRLLLRLNDCLWLSELRVEVWEQRL